LEKGALFDLLGQFISSYETAWCYLTDIALIHR
jgi:hypothetical protein